MLVMRAGHRHVYVSDNDFHVWGVVYKKVYCGLYHKWYIWSDGAYTMRSCTPTNIWSDGAYTMRSCTPTNNLAWEFLLTASLLGLAHGVRL